MTDKSKKADPQPTERRERGRRGEDLYLKIKRVSGSNYDCFRHDFWHSN